MRWRILPPNESFQNNEQIFTLSISQLSMTFNLGRLPGAQYSVADQLDFWYVAQLAAFMR
jgi:hypothetical protein